MYTGKDFVVTVKILNKTSGEHIIIISQKLDIKTRGLLKYM